MDTRDIDITDFTMQSGAVKPLPAPLPLRMQAHVMTFSKQFPEAGLREAQRFFLKTWMLEMLEMIDEVQP